MGTFSSVLNLAPDTTKKVRFIKNRVFVILDPKIVLRLSIDEDSFFEESINAQGEIVLKHVRKKSEFTGVE